MFELSYNKEINSYVIEFKNYINFTGDTTEFSLDFYNFLADKNFTQANEIYEDEDFLFIDDSSLQTYKVSVVNIIDLINDGKTELFPQYNLETYVDWNNKKDIDFLRWYFGNNSLSVAKLKSIIKFNII